MTDIYLPPEVNCLLTVAAHCLDSSDKINVIVADKQNHLRYLGVDAAVPHCAKGIGIWAWMSNEADFDSLFTCDRPGLFNFHGYPWLIQKLIYRRTDSRHFHARGYKENDNINTPMHLWTRNQIDRFSLAIDAIDGVRALRAGGAHIKGKMEDASLDCQRYAEEHGIDSPEFPDWRWNAPA